jgi:hypothetical protein
MIRSHSMNAILPEQRRKAKLVTLFSYCADSKPVKLLAR